MAGSERGNVGYKRVVIIAVISTGFAILMDHIGVVNALEDVMNKWL